MINIEIDGSTCIIKGNKAADILDINKIRQEEAVEIIKRKPSNVRIIFAYDCGLDYINVELYRELAKAIIEYNIAIDIDSKYKNSYSTLSIRNYQYGIGRTTHIYIEIFEETSKQNLDKDEINEIIGGEIKTLLHLNKCNILYNKEITEDNGEIYYDSRWIYQDITMKDKYSVVKHVYKKDNRIVQSLIL